MSKDFARVSRRQAYRHMASGIALTVAMLAGGGASAQTLEQAPAPERPVVSTPESTTADGDVVVTGSRITSSGFNAPTPTQVIGSADLQRLAAEEALTP